MPKARTSTAVADGGGYTRDLRWGYRAGYGEGTFPEPYRGGGSYGRGYDWAEDRPPDVRQGGASPREQEPARAHAHLSRRRRRRRRYRAQRPWRYHPGGRHQRAAGETAAYEAAAYEAAAYDAAYGPRYASAGPYRRRWRRPSRAGTAERDYDRAYPYFASAAALEATSGYPPGETLSPDTLPRRSPHRTFYGERC